MPPQNKNINWRNVGNWIIKIIIMISGMSIMTVAGTIVGMWGYGKRLDDIEALNLGHSKRMYFESFRFLLDNNDGDTLYWATGEQTGNAYKTDIRWNAEGKRLGFVYGKGYFVPYEIREDVDCKDYVMLNMADGKKETGYLEIKK